MRKAIWLSAALSDLAAAALEASLAVARRQSSGTGPGRFPEDEVRVEKKRQGLWWA